MRKKIHSFIRWSLPVVFVLSCLAVAADDAEDTAKSHSATTSLAEAVSGKAEQPGDDGKLRIIAIGAHPDDCEIKVGGVAAIWSAQGHHVKFVSLTNGNVGHWRTVGGPLALRRRSETQAAAKALGIEASQVLDNRDGELMPTLENRKTVIRLIREWKADIVFTHRTNDYHPDHRYTGVIVQDAAYLVTVPFLCPYVPHLQSNPVFMYFSDRFQSPHPLRPDIVIAIDEVIEQKLDACLCMESQFIEGGVAGNEKMIPKNDTQMAERRQQVREHFARRLKAVADKYRDKLIELYGEEKGKKVRYAEVFELCEYGRQPSPARLRKLFPLPRR